ncbi:MAG TPA: 50S ribosomal protein L24 [Anaerolineales bacterium]|uniref:Large ribosomal subunit protein uL24 n=1 Tax=uncultured Chloroflexi bacterium Rifle_16ft_4_minimus_1477 TaxID=1665058 RepID=A0A0H4T0T4_9CHLR|nr:50S ribosomal protein L24, large subunit ribosomal protein L24 [uncultured Chloroflexi bacterium Rifle_16ft_4_minimus_1477]HLD94432.1 50S ribosomal protein L24 [Anaerolineales bacterium]
MKTKIRKGDTVEIVTGKEHDKGKRGEVIKVLPKEARLVVQKLNIRKKHQRAVQTQGRQLNPGVIEFEAPLHISNVMLVCPKCGKPARVGIQRGEDGKAHRVCKNCGKQID